MGKRATRNPRAIRTERSGGRVMGRAWALSLGFHVALGAWLVWFSPVRIYDPSAPATTVSPSRASRMAGQLRERQAEPLSQSLRELEQIRGEMAKLEQEKREEFLEFARKSASQANEEATSLQLAITRAQQEMIASLDASLPEIGRFVAMRANASFDRLYHSHEEVRARHVKVLALQEQSSGVLSLGGDAYAEAERAQKAATEAQHRLGEAMKNLDEARDTARGSRERTPMEREYDHYTYHLVRAEARIADGPRVLQEMDAEIAGIDAMEERVKGEITKAPESAKAKLQSQLEIVMKEREAQITKKNRAVKDLEGAQRELPKLSAKASEIAATLAKAPPAPTEADKELERLHVEALKLQKEALALQEAAGAAIEKIDPKAVPADPERDVLAALGDPSQPVTQGEIAEHDLKGIYQEAVSAEESITAAYRRHRAMELSMIRRIPLERSLQMTNAAKSARPELSQALSGAVSSGEGLKEARDAIQSARGEISSMLHAGQAMLSQARGTGTAEGISIRFDHDAGFSHEQWERLQELAAEDDLARAKDLSGAMGGEGFGLNGDGSEGKGDGQGGPGGAFGLSGGAGHGGSGSGSGGPGGGASSFLPGGPGGPPALAAGGEGKSVPALPGRRIASQGESLPWVFADSWYILGPFDNPRRLNIDTKFPPETVVDLNASYPGKNGVSIGWEHFQSGTPNVMPPFRAYNKARKIDGLSGEMSYRYNLQYAIYYAYTEIRLEQDADLWVAIGSDDHSKVWINDQLVWASGKGAKAWRPDEGYRKVHFRAGMNRVLYRIENGNDRTEFSLMLGMNP